MLSFLKFDIRFMIWPFAVTASTPVTDPCRFPYRNNLKPPAFVDTFPPMWQLPLAPKSKGTQSPFSWTADSKFSNTTPDWQVTMPEYSSMDSILFIELIEMTTSSKTGTDPPTFRKFHEIIFVFNLISDSLIRYFRLVGKRQVFVRCNISWLRKLLRLFLVAKLHLMNLEHFSSNQCCSFECHRHAKLDVYPKSIQIVQHPCLRYQKNFRAWLDSDPEEKFMTRPDEKFMDWMHSWQIVGTYLCKFWNFRRWSCRK